MPARESLVTLVLSGGCVDRGGAAPGREPVPGTETVDVTDIDQQPRRPGRADAVQPGQRAAALIHQERQLLVGRFDPAIDAIEVLDELARQTSTHHIRRIPRPGLLEQRACLHADNDFFAHPRSVPAGSGAGG